MTLRSGTLLLVVMDRYKMINVFYLKNKKTKIKKIREKHLRLRYSYSIISAPLRDLDDMFNLKVHKEIIAYRI